MHKHVPNSENDDHEILLRIQAVQANLHYLKNNSTTTEKYKIYLILDFR